MQKPAARRKPNPSLGLRHQFWKWAAFDGKVIRVKAPGEKWVTDIKKKKKNTSAEHSKGPIQEDLGCYQKQRDFSRGETKNPREKKASNLHRRQPGTWGSHLRLEHANVTHGIRSWLYTNLEGFWERKPMWWLCRQFLHHYCHQRVLTKIHKHRYQGREAERLPENPPLHTKLAEKLKGGITWPIKNWPSRGHRRKGDKESASRTHTDISPSLWK